MVIDFILVVMLAVILGTAGRYVYQAKKSGKKCIGCPEGCTCGGGQGGHPCCGCGHEKPS